MVTSRFFLVYLFLFFTLCFNAQDIHFFDKRGKISNETEGYYIRKKESANSYISKYTNGNSIYFEGKIIEASIIDENLNKYSGQCKWYYRSGKIKAIRNFTENGIEDGKSEYYYETGKIWKEMDFTGGLLKDNMFVEYTEDGRLSKIFEENFNNNSNDWDLFTNKESSCKINNGVLELASKSKNPVSSYISIPSNSSDMAIEATFDFVKINNDQKVGFIYDFKDWNNYNYFYLTSGGMYIGSVYEGISSNKIEGMFATSFQRNKKNRMKIINLGEKAVFSINGDIQYSCDRFPKVGSNVGFVEIGWGTIFVDEFVYKEINYKNKNAVVSKSDLDVKHTGSGILISENGYVITNEHVINSANSIQVELTSEGITKLYSAILIQKDADNDLAVLKIDDPEFKPLEKLRYSFKESGAVEVGATVFTIGYPLALSGMGKEAKYTDGKISAKTGYNGSLNSFQSTIAIQPGNSGGPVFNDKGELIGLINSGIKSADNVAYAIKLNYIKNLIEAIGETTKLPGDKTIVEMSIEEKIKILSNYVTLIKVK